MGDWSSGWCRVKRILWVEVAVGIKAVAKCSPGDTRDPYWNTGQTMKWVASTTDVMALGDGGIR